MSKQTENNPPTQSDLDELLDELLGDKLPREEPDEVPPAILQALASAAAAEGESTAADDLEISEDHDPVTSGEVEERRQRWPLILAIVAFAIVALGIASIYLRDYYAARSAVAEQQKLAADSTLSDAIALIQEADTVFIGLDKAIESTISKDDLSDLQALLGQVDQAKGTLDAAIAKATEAEDGYRDSSSQQMARYAIDAANYRKQMLDLGVKLTNADIAAMQSADQLDAAWSHIIEADLDMRQAASLLAQSGSSQINQSLTLNNSAKDALTQARATLDVAQDYFPAVDFSAIYAYLDASDASVELAIEADTALKNGDQADSEAKSNAFQDKNAEAVQLALAIPEDPMDLIVSAYNSETSDWHDSYQNLREQAAETDVYLRTWVSDNAAAGAAN